MKRTVGRFPFVAAFLIAALLAAPASAQQAAELVVRGRVLGPDNAVLPNQRVVLHRVDAAGGATIAETTTAADGRFELKAPGSTDTAAIYFTATRYEGELFIGPPFKSEMTSMEQLIQVGVPGTSASAMIGEGTPATQAPPPGRPVTSRNWLLLLIPLLGVIAVAIYTFASRHRIPPERALLIRVAELDERLGTAPPAQRESLQAERERLMTLLRED